MYKLLFERHITYYNGQWCCYLCKAALRNLRKAQRHAEDAHSIVSTQALDPPSKSHVTLRKNAYKTFVNHGVVTRNAQQDYFCTNCQRSIPSLNNIYRHLMERDHQKCMSQSNLKCSASTNAKSKRSTNEPGSSGSTNKKRSSVSANVAKPSTKRVNESSDFSKVQSIYKLKGASSSSAKTVNGTIAGVPYALLQEAKAYKHFLAQHTIHYGQWDCHLCESTFQRLADAKCHSQEAHSDVDVQISDFREKSSGTTSQKLLNPETTTRNMPQDYFCAPCQCPIPSLDHFYQHSIGSKHKRMMNFNERIMKYISTNVVPEDPANQQESVNKTDDRKVSVAASDRNDFIDHLPSNFRAEAKSTIFFKYSCDQCNKVIKEDDMINHEITVHKSDMKSSLGYIDDWSPAIKNFNIAIHYPLFRCLFCNEVIHGMLSLAIHFSKYQHEENVKFLTGIKERGRDNRKNAQIKPRELLSLISFGNDDGTVRIKEQTVMYVKNPIGGKFVYVCFACSHFHGDHGNHVIEHLCETEHLKHFKDILLTYNCVHDILISREHGTNGVREVPSTSEVDVSLIAKPLRKLRIDETANTERRDDDLIAAANASNKNDELNRRKKEDNPGLFVSLDILTDITKTIYPQYIYHDSAQATQPNKNALDRYNKMYRREFLDFEEIMFTCSERKLNEMKLNLPFFVLHYDNMLCLVCGDPQLCNAQAVYEHINCQEHFERLAQLRNNVEHFELLKELIQPVRFQQAKCYACDEIFYGVQHELHGSVDFKHHARFSAHEKNRERSRGQVESILGEFQSLCYNIQYFACVGCKMRCKQKIKFLEHLDANHKAVLNDKNNSMFDFCLTCATLWYDGRCARETCTNYQRHCRQLTHQYLRRSNDFEVTSLPQSLQKLLKNVNGIAGDLFNLSNDVLNNRRVTQVTDALKHILETHQLPVEVYIYGSRVTGLALPSSDIDIFLKFDDECTKPELIEIRSKQIQNCLRTDQENWNIELTLNKSRTPIITVKHRLIGLQCDISFMKGLSVENSKLIRSFNTAYPPCQKLTLFLKKWLLLGGLSGPDGIKNYALVWLVIFYLQVKFKIPSIAALIKSHNQSKIVSGWETGVGDTILINAPKLPIHELLLGFFEYYKSFNYMHFVICPLLGETCQKRAFTEISNTELPNSMALYIAQLRNKNPEYFRIDSPMCVQDPFDLSHNLTKAVSILTLKHFKYYCNESSKVLQHVATTSSKKKFKVLR